MKNHQIYAKTLTFSLRRFGLSLLGLLAVIALPTLTFVLTMNLDAAVTLISTGIALVAGIVIAWALGHFMGYMQQAAQIAMIARAVTSGELPDDVYAAGTQAVRDRFATVAAYYALHRIISGITTQLTRALTTVTDSIGESSKNDTVKGIGAIISAIVTIILTYVTYCCLGWVFYKSEESAVKATLDGAVVYFQNWKALLLNVAKVLLVIVLSLVIIGAPLYLLSGAVTGNMTGLQMVFAAIAEATAESETVLESTDIAIMFNGIVAFAVWIILYNTFIAPYVLVSVMRGYMTAAIENPPCVDLYGKLAGISKKFAEQMKNLPGAKTAAE